MKVGRDTFIEIARRLRAKFRHDLLRGSAFTEAGDEDAARAALVMQAAGGNRTPCNYEKID